MQSFGDTVGEKFAYEEIDGAILLSQTVQTEAVSYTHLTLPTSDLV